MLVHVNDTTQCICVASKLQQLRQPVGFWEFVAKAGALLGLIATVRSLMR